MLLLLVVSLLSAVLGSGLTIVYQSNVMPKLDSPGQIRIENDKALAKNIREAIKALNFYVKCASAQGICVDLRYGYTSSHGIYGPISVDAIARHKRTVL